MLANTDYENEYAKAMSCLNEQNKEYQELLDSKEYKLGNLIARTINCIAHLNFKSIRGYLRNLRWKRKLSQIAINQPDFSKDSTKPAEYLSNKRIAVYTCIFGNYDQIQEPLLHPDNIDYYLITDRKITGSSTWKTLILDDLDESLTNVEKNRFCKMHPDLIFKNYEYSIYIDGNVKVISDLTPYIYKLNHTGIGMHKHNQRRCTYDELMALLVAYKAKKRDVNKYKQFLEECGFPRNYGLLECNVIVREHHNATCKKIMEQWWEQFETGIKRDQVSLPYVLFKNNIKVEDIAVLGNDVYKNYDLRIAKHL